MTHPHREFPKKALGRPASVQILKYLSEPPEVNSALFRFIKEGGHRHQPSEVEVLSRFQSLDDLGQFRFVGSRLGWLVCKVNLNEYNRPHPFLTCDPIQTTGQIHGVNGVNDVES